MIKLLHKINYKWAVVWYCIILCLVLIVTALPYGGFYLNTNPGTVEFSDHFSVYADGRLETAEAVFPYSVKTPGAAEIELHGTIPETPYYVAVLETVVFQKDVSIFLDGILLKERIFESKSLNQSSPGSGRLLVPLPEDSAGKEIVIKLSKAVPEDNGPIAKLNIINGLMSERSIISLSGAAFLATSLMFFVGICLLITSLAYAFGGIKMYSLCSMSMFVITTSLWVLCNSKAMQYFTDNWVLIHNLEYMAFYSCPLWIWMFFSQNWNYKKRLCRAANTSVITFFMITLTAKAVGISDFYYFLKLFHVLAFANIALILAIGIMGYKKQTLPMKIFFWGIGFLCFTSLIDLMRYYTIFSPDAMAFFFIAGIISMGACLFLTFILMSKEKFKNIIEDNVYKELAFTDILTGLNSRAKWENDITEMERKKDTFRSIIAVMIDVNDLKVVNDNFGHQAGDQLLITVSRALKKQFDSIGSCYRLGGDEFCVLVTDKDFVWIEQRLALADLALKQTDLPHPVTAAWGYAEYKKNLHGNMNDLLKEADNKMYEAKRNMKEIRGRQAEDGK